MTHLTNFTARLLLGAAALSAALVGCQKAPEVVNPNFNPETDQVSAAFVFSVATGSSSPSTKMSATNVQKAGFLGIDSAKLVLFSNPKDAPLMPYVEGSSVPLANGIFDLGAVLTPGAITAANNSTNSSNRVLQLSLPLTADAALLYGKAHVENPTSRGKVHGYMDFKGHLADNPADTWFGVQRRIGNEANVTKYDATGRLMIYAINTILATSLPATTTSYTVAGYTSSGVLPAISWKALGHQWEINNDSALDHTNNPYGRTGDVTTQKELERSLGKAYATFTHLKSGEYRAGSSAAVKAMIQSLYEVLSHTAGATPLNDPEANAIRLAEAAITNVGKFFKSNWSYQEISDIYTAIVPSMKTEAQWNTEFGGASDLNGYPYMDFGIPEGAAQLAFDSTNDTFSYTNPNKALVTPGATFDPRKYVFAPELVYYVNSPLWITAKSALSVSDYPNGTGPWMNTGEGSKWTLNGWDIGKVSSTTRGVAIRDNVNYGVAMLETNVDWTAEAASSGLLDNRAAMTNNAEGNRTILVADAHFTLRGILIGGIHPRYNWQFLPRALTSAEAAEKLSDNVTPRYGNFDGVIYDDAVPFTAVPTKEDATYQSNYTLVFDNLDYSKADNLTQNDVYVALEFVNGGDAFWGRDNLIPSGGVFYLGAKLTLNGQNKENNTIITWPTDHQVPPIDETTGASKQIPRIFMQDFLTKATFRIGRQSLQEAYYSVPDLASSQMSFGLSVDLSWETGYVYDIELGAGDGIPVVPAP